MKKVLGWALLAVAFVTTTAISTSSPENMHSIEGTWEQVSFYNYDGQNIVDTVDLVEGHTHTHTHTRAVFVSLYCLGDQLWFS